MRPDRVEWVFLDAFGTLVFLDGPFERLQANLAAEGHAVPLGDVERALRMEFAYYVGHSRTGRDAASLRRLRLDCAGAFLDGLLEAGHDVALPLERAAEVLMASIEFHLYADVLPAFDALRAEGRHLGLISNWDCSLPEPLRRLGLCDCLEVVIVSALCGCEKPERAIFDRALQQAGVPPHAALHVGDSHRNDFLGARAAGMQAVLLDRERKAAPRPGVAVVHDLREVVRWLGG